MTTEDSRRTLLGYPRGLFLVASTELWERFSYWGLVAIFVLFLTGGLATGGFGWEKVAALKLYGLYAGAAFAGPLIGGWIANNYWGERRCIRIGGLLVVAGHFCLAGPAAIPWLVAQGLDVDVHTLWQHAGVALGQLQLSSLQWHELAKAAAQQGISPSIAAWVYRSISLSYFGGLLLVIAGTGLIKPTISSIISHFFAPHDRRREAAFGVLFIAIYIGCILGTFVVGYLGEHVAWHWGFAAAGIGMLASLIFYLLKEHEYLGNIGVAPVNAGRGFAALRNLDAAERDRLKVILWQAVLAAIYATAFFQAGGLLVLFINEHLARDIAGWTLPASWLINVAAILFVAVMPMAIQLWNRLEIRGRNPGAPLKLAWGLMVIGVAYLLLAWLTFKTSLATGEKIPWPWMALVYACFGISDILVWPNQIALTSRLAPEKLSAAFIGGWYVTIGIGTWLSGYIGSLGYSWGLRPLFLALGLCLVTLGLFAWWFNPRLIALTHGLERCAFGSRSQYGSGFEAFRT